MSKAKHTKDLKRKIALTTTIFSASMIGYGGRNAYGACTNAANTYSCSGANLTTQNINGSYSDNAIISTVSGFSVSTTSGDGIAVSGYGELSFTDTNSSSIVTTDSSANGLTITNTITSGATDGSVTITADSTISGGSNGIYVSNYYGAGATTLDISGDVTGTTGHGIYTYTAYSSGIEITTESGSTVSGGSNGIQVYNGNSADVTIDISGDVTATNYSIYTTNSGSDSLILRTGASLSSANGVNLGGGTDTLTLDGNGSED